MQHFRASGHGNLECFPILHDFRDALDVLALLDLVIGKPCPGTRDVRWTLEPSMGRLLLPNECGGIWGPTAGRISIPVWKNLAMVMVPQGQRGPESAREEE